MTVESMSPILRTVLIAATLLFASGCGGTRVDDGGGRHPGQPIPAAVSVTGPSGAASAPTTGPAGVVLGHVRFKGVAPSIRPLRMTGSADCAALHRHPPPDESVKLHQGLVEGALVWISDAPAEAPASPTAPPATLDQKGCVFIPRVVALRAGQTLIITNSDDTLHNVHTRSTVNPAWNKGFPMAGIRVEHVFTSPEDPFVVGCDLHDWMRAHIAVFGHRLFRLTDATGSFRLDGVPVGVRTVRVWHEHLGDRMISVTVRAGETAPLDIVLGKP